MDGAVSEDQRSRASCRRPVVVPRRNSRRGSSLRSSTSVLQDLSPPAGAASTTGWLINVGDAMWGSGTSKTSCPPTDPGQASQTSPEVVKVVLPAGSSTLTTSGEARLTVCGSAAAGWHITACRCAADNHPVDLVPYTRPRRIERRSPRVGTPSSTTPWSRCPSRPSGGGGAGSNPAGGTDPRNPLNSKNEALDQPLWQSRASFLRPAVTG